MRVAIRRALRVGRRNSGIPVEDLGVVADETHLLTRRDVMGLRPNTDLLAHAARLLAKQ
jgi:hypothetical protein